MRGTSVRNLAEVLGSLKEVLGRVEQVKNVLESGIRCEVDAITLILRRSKAWKSTEVLADVLGQGLRKQGQNLRQTFSVPDGVGAVHWRRNEVLAAGVGLALGQESIAAILKEWLGPAGRRRRDPHWTRRTRSSRP